MCEGDIIMLPANAKNARKHRISREGEAAAKGALRRSCSLSMLRISKCSVDSDDVSMRIEEVGAAPAAAPGPATPSATSSTKGGGAVGGDEGGVEMSEPFTRGGSAVLGNKRAGSWFGHVELLRAFDDANEKGSDTPMTADVPWQHSYKARTACDLLLLVKDDFFLLLDDFPFLRDMLEVEPQAPLKRTSIANLCFGSVSAASASTTSAAGPANVRPLSADALDVVDAVDAVEGSLHSSCSTDSSSGLDQAASCPPATLATADGGLGPLAPIPQSPCLASGQPAASSRWSGLKAGGLARLTERSESSQSSGAGDEGSLGEESEGAEPSGGRGSPPDALGNRRGSSGAARAQRLAMLGGSGGFQTGVSITHCRNSTCGKSASKSPKLLGGQSSAEAYRPTSRGWQQARKMKGEGGLLAAARSGSSSPGREASAAGSAGAGAAAAASPADWLKQRLAHELLGDAVVAPWQIDEDMLFSRIESLLASANALVESGLPPVSPPADTAERTLSGSTLSASASSSASAAGAASTADARAAQEYALHAMLLSMQRSVQESADRVREFIDESESAVKVEAESKCESKEEASKLEPAESASAQIRSAQVESEVKAESPPE